MVRVFLCLLGSTVFTALAASTNEVDHLINQLGAEAFKERKAASDTLWKMGIDVVPKLERAMTHDDPEVKIRASVVVEKLTGGDIPGLAKKTREILKRFHDSVDDQRDEAFDELIGQPKGVEVAWILVRYHLEDPEPAVREASVNLRERARRHILAGELDEAESCLRLRAKGPYTRSPQDFAVFLALLPEDRAVREEAPEIMARRALVRGELDTVLEHAEPGDARHETVLRMRNDWRQLASMHEKNYDKDDIRDLGLRASYHRLAGSAERHQQALDDLQAHAANQFDADEIWYAAEAFLLNDQFKKGIAVLADHGDYRAVDLAWRISDYQTILDFKEDGLSDEEREKLAFVQRRIKNPDPYKRPEPKEPPEKEELSAFANLVLETDPQTEADWLPLKRWALADHKSWHRGIRSVRDQLTEKQLAFAYDWSLQSSLADDWGHFDVLRKCHWLRSVEAGDFREAQNRFERHRIPLHVERFKYNEPYYYLTASAEIFHLNTLRAIKEDRREDLPRLMEEAAPLLVNYNLKFHRDLRKRGHGDVGEMMLDHHRRYLKSQIKHFPNCASLLNSYAWNVAISGKDFETGLAFSERSLELIPGHPQFLDTKAELLFQLKRDKEALAILGQAIDILPDNEYYQRQRKRMKAGEREVLPE